MRIDIIKCHGTGNDFVLIDEYSNDYKFTDFNRSVLSKELCDRKGLIGADGILFFQKSDICDARMSMFNPDGSEAEMCGNGIRCIGRYASEKFNKVELFIETLKGIQKMTREKDLLDNVKTYSVNLKPISLKLEDFPINSSAKELIDEKIHGFSNLKFTAVSIGNPHIISICETIDIALLKELGFQANNNKGIFPEGVNVSFCQIIDKNKIAVVTYERGAGITYACGSAMTASSLTSVVLNHCQKSTWVEVYNRGGITKCRVEKNEEGYEVYLLGNATFVYESSIHFDFENPNLFKSVKGNTFTDEINSYSKIIETSEDILSECNINIPV